jgi:hypothetical protein
VLTARTVKSTIFVTVSLERLFTLEDEDDVTSGV